MWVRWGTRAMITAWQLLEERAAAWRRASDRHGDEDDDVQMAG